MSILCVGDIHIKPNNTHLVDLLEQHVLEYIDRYSVKLVILLGDILDTFERLHTQTLNRAYQLVHKIRALSKIAILVGNHDYINNQQFLSDQHWMNAMKDWTNVYIIDRTQSLKLDSLFLVFVPYVPPKRFQEALDTLQEWKNADYIFAHQEFKGCKMGAIMSSEGDEWDITYPLIISGHIHDYQKPQSNILYIGASIQNSFGDQTSPRLLLIQGKEQQELELSLPKKKTIYASLDKIPIEQIRQNLQTPDTDMVRIVIKCDYEQFKIFTKTTEYEELSQNSKCKIVHKPIEKSTEDKIETTPEELLTDFSQSLYDKVLFSRNEYLYSVYHQIVHDTTISPDDVLIV
jgi:predicted phosphodiesterase